MAGSAPEGRRSWRDALAVCSGAEALAVALWLWPASVHIVQWPVEGPRRLALVAPAWQLGVWLAAGIALAALTLLVVRRPGLGRVAAPLSLLWLWAVPYLPWLGDRLPLLLVLAGPLRWGIAVTALGSVIVRSLRLPPSLKLRRTGPSLGGGRQADHNWPAKAGHYVAPDTVLHDRPSPSATVVRGAIFVVSFALYLCLGVLSARSIGPGGDEPHYLVITESLLRDRDLKIENNHRQGDYKVFYQGELRPDFFERGANGEIYSIHAPGLPALVLPAYVVGGRLGVVAFIALLAALAALAIFDLSHAIAGRTAALLTWAASCLTVPFIPQAWLIFPEVPGALIVAWAALWTWQSIDRPVFVWLARGITLGLLTWLHTKFVVFEAIFAAALMLRLWRRPRDLAAFALPIAILGAAWLYSFYLLYGVFDPEAPYGAYSATYVLTKNIPHGLIGILFDQKFGLLFYSPIYLAAIAGAWLILKRPDTRYLGIAALLAAGAFVATTARLYMFWGGSSAPARFLVPVVPCLAPLVALAVADAKCRLARSLVCVGLTVSIGVAMAGAVWPARLMLFSDPHGRARVLEAIQAGSPLALVVPTFTEPSWVAQIAPLALWAFVVAAAMTAMFVASKIGRPSMLRLIATGCLVTLFGGAVVTAHPDAAIRSETARRGDLDVLWRFDGNRFRTFDYERQARATPERLRELTTVVVEPDATSVGTTSLALGPFTLPPGGYDARIWFAGAAARQGEVEVALSPEVVIARASGPLQNPTALDVQLPFAARRLTLHVGDAQVAAAVTRVELAPRAVLPAGERPDITIRRVDPLAHPEFAFLAYSDEHAYPERGVFWSRGTAETRVFVGTGGASKMTLMLSTGPMSGEVTLSAAGIPASVTMTGGEVKTLSFDLPPGQTLVPLTVRSSVMFRPSEQNKTSTDMRGLGCQVRVNLE